MEHVFSESSKKPISQMLGAFFEEKVNSKVQQKYEAPVLTGEPIPRVWYRVPVKEGLSGDGSEYHIYIKKGSAKQLCIYFSGGGMAWNEYTAARPSNCARIAAGLPNYYWNNLRPATEVRNIRLGLMETGNPKNPFDNWSFLEIPYATGDFHIGGRDFTYMGENGQPQVLHFHGFRNFIKGMDTGAPLFPDPETILIAGDSAGAFAVPALTDCILKKYYPGCGDVTVLSDSAQLVSKNWQRLIRDIWGADEMFWRPVRGRNLTVEWYRELYGKYGDRLKYLYAGSVRDYLLSWYNNEIVNAGPKPGLRLQRIYFKKMREMMRELKSISPFFGLFVYDWRNPFSPYGTVHTALRHPRFYLSSHGGPSMAAWLYDAVNGNISDGGIKLLRG